MANNETDTLQVEKSLKQLKVSYDMYETTKKQTERRMKDALNPDGTKKYTADDGIIPFLRRKCGTNRHHRRAAGSGTGGAEPTLRSRHKKHLVFCAVQTL